MRVIDRSIQNHKQILYNDRHVLRGPIPLNRDTYYDLYESNKQFAVDAFNTGINVQHYFLTRFHPDQYAGLAEKFPRYIYTSEITGKLIQSNPAKWVFNWKRSRFAFSLSGSENTQSGWVFIAHTQSRCTSDSRRCRDHTHQCVKVWFLCRN